MDRDDEESLEFILSRHAGTAVHPACLLAEMILATEDVAGTERFLRQRADQPGIAAVVSLLERHREVAASIIRLADAHTRMLDTSHENESSIDRFARFFDDAVQRNEETSVALYSFGSAEVLAETAEEIARLFEAWGVLGSALDALELGSGIGRVAAAIASRVREVVGVDVSNAMVAAAQRRCAHLANVRFEPTDGRDLHDFEPARFDLVYAVDSFPYIVAAGQDLVARHFAETHRVLRPGGHFAILNYSYRGDPKRDGTDVQRLARAHGFGWRNDDDAAGTIWHGRAWHLVKP